MAVWSNITSSKVIEFGRIDAEFFKPEYLLLEKQLKVIGSVKFGEMITVLTDYHANGSYEILRHHVSLLDQIDFAYMVRATDLENDNYEENSKYVDEHAYNFLSKSKVFGGEILINKIGSAGKVYLMPKLDIPCTLGMNLFLIRTIDNFPSYYIYAFLMCAYGLKYMERFISGAVPLSITKASVCDVLIPNFNINLRSEVSDLVEKHINLKKESKFFYTQAQQLIESELGLDNLSFQRPIGYTAKLSETVTGGRFDADYFQTPFRQIQSHLDRLETAPLFQLVEFIKGIEVGSKAYTASGIPFLRVSNIKEKAIELGPSDKYISDDLYTALSAYQPQVGELLLTKDGTAGVCFAVDEEVNGVISGGIVRLLPHRDDIPNEYLALVINSKACRMQVEQDCSGALILHWKPSSIRKLRIPLLSKPKMQEIADLVSKSKQAKRESEQLLEQAKSRIEHLIEEAVQS